MKNIIKLFTMIILLVFTFQNCNETIAPENDSNVGTLSLKITDAPFPVGIVASANVTITKIEARKTDDKDSTKFITLTDISSTYNLLELRNGVTEDLLNINVPVGSYDLIRLYVSDASLQLKDGKTFNVKVPSGKQTGIKVFISPSIEVVGGLSSELLLDFDISKSFVIQGNLNSPDGIKGFHFKPVIRAVNTSSAGRVTGIVTDTSSTAIFDAQVWLKQDSTISNTFSDSNGGYTLIGIPQGNYSIYASKVGYDTIFVSNISIVAGNKTEQNFVLSITNNN